MNMNRKGSKEQGYICRLNFKEKKQLIIDLSRPVALQKPMIEVCLANAGSLESDLFFSKKITARFPRLENYAATRSHFLTTTEII